MNSVEVSRSNWMALAIVLMALICAFAFTLLGFVIGESSVKSNIYNSGYSITETHSKTNHFVVIEKIQ